MDATETTGSDRTWRERVLAWADDAPGGTAGLDQCRQIVGTPPDGAGEAEPLGPELAAASQAVDLWEEAAEGDSDDVEHAAALTMAEALRALVCKVYALPARAAEAAEPAPTSDAVGRAAMEDAHRAADNGWRDEGVVIGLRAERGVGFYAGFRAALAVAGAGEVAAALAAEVRTHDREGACVCSTCRIAREHGIDTDPRISAGAGEAEPCPARGDAATPDPDGLAWSLRRLADLAVEVAADDSPLLAAVQDARERLSGRGTSMPTVSAEQRDILARRFLAQAVGEENVAFYEHHGEGGAEWGASPRWAQAQATADAALAALGIEVAP
ncbi:hypothetical protein CHO01_22010 [Cellulomonas hominis]|uniref:Uncharacterized protein n=1 Tax=Cellulomonas hominis TaxID=156981 RepID=A0A511FCW1_9CELL|nr:hypothetical protein [Cellulomonas hominis]MBB5474674.1 hypothetical protein [Cellulomonas hominis]NKY05846.1 hypothetical protein [Cellulomonas hominis]GEL47085.1 hypothetical protein CHO01_22010 [Cellulomonas hominis]